MIFGVHPDFNPIKNRQPFSSVFVKSQLNIFVVSLVRFAPIFVEARIFRIVRFEIVRVANEVHVAAKYPVCQQKRTGANRIPGILGAIKFDRFPGQHRGLKHCQNVAEAKVRLFEEDLEFGIRNDFHSLDRGVVVKLASAFGGFVLFLLELVESDNRVAHQPPGFGFVGCVCHPFERVEKVFWPDPTAFATGKALVVVKVDVVPKFKVERLAVFTDLWHLCQQQRFQFQWSFEIFVLQQRLIYITATYVVVGAGSANRVKRIRTCGRHWYVGNFFIGRR